MYMFRLVLLYTVVFLIGIVITELAGLERTIAFTVCVVLVLAVSFSSLLYTLYGTKNVAKVERYIVNHQKNPIFRHLYVSAHGTVADELQAIEAVLAKYQQPLTRTTYLFIQAIVQDDLEKAYEAAQQIPKDAYRQYSLAYVEALRGNAEKARSYKLAKPWMTYAIEALIAYEAKDLDAFEREAQRSIEAARGIQYYQSVYAFKKMKQKLEMQDA